MKSSGNQCLDLKYASNHKAPPSSSLVFFFFNVLWTKCNINEPTVICQYKSTTSCSHENHVIMTESLLHK
uniref:Uncharacterized protein n=1 Tax=Rhizophora mucronata TaxID=61149 RepID=A0A2P2NQ30_RHIMU